MGALRITAKLAGGILLGVLLVLALAFGLAQMRVGKTWLATALGRALSSPGEVVTITDLAGLVPFDMRVRAIEITDQQGPRVIVREVAFDIVPADLLSGHLTFRRLTATEVGIERAPQDGSGIDLGPLLHPPLAVTIERMAVDRLRLGPALIGEPITMTLAASGTVERGHAAADLDLRRIDATPGQAKFHFALGGTPFRLDLSGDVTEPSGRLLAEFLGRKDALPVSLHLAGDGPLADWRGRLTAKAGSDAALDAVVDVVGGAGYRVTTRGTIRAKPLLPPRLQALLGDGARFAASLGVTDTTVTLSDFSFMTSAGTLTAHGRYDEASEAIAGEATLKLPMLAALGPLSGSATTGSAMAQLSLEGGASKLAAHLSITGDAAGFDGNRAKSVNASFDLSTSGNPFTATTPIDITGRGHLIGLALASTKLPADLANALDWRLTAQLDRQARRLVVSQVAIEDGSAAVNARFTVEQDSATGQAHLELPEISRVTDATLHGALALDADFHAAPDGAATIVLSGALQQPKPGATFLGRLVGKEASLAGTVQRLSDGTLTATDISLSADNAHMTGDARRASNGEIAADFRAEFPRLAAFDGQLSGGASLTGHAGGKATALSLKVSLAADNLTLGAAHLDHLEGQLDVAELAKTAGDLAAKFRSDGLEGSLWVRGGLSSGEALRLSQLRLDAAGTKLEGDLTYRFADRTVEGNLTGSASDLKPWSKLLGTSIAGQARLKAALSAAKGQSIDITFDADKVSWDMPTPGKARRLHATVRLADLFAMPTGRAELQIDDTSIAGVALERVRLDGKAAQPGHFAISAEARGKYRQAFTLASTATAIIAKNSTELQVTRLTGTFGDQPITLRRALRASYRSGDLVFADLALGIGSGRVTGTGSIEGKALSLHLLAENLPVDAIGQIADQPYVSGSLGFDLTVGGTRQRPEGDFVIDGEELRLAAANRPDLPPLSVVVSGTWRDGRAQAKGRIAAPQNAALGFTATLPLVLDPDRLMPRMPPKGDLALHLEGDGDLGNLADLLPIGDDRLAGRFDIDVSVGGTVDAPAASGRLSVRNGSYERMDTGTKLVGVSFDLIGDHDRLALQNFTAGDGAKGTLSVQGAINLAAASGPTLDIRGRLQTFRALALDPATAMASGEIHMTGAVAAPTLTSELRIDTAELRVPEKLPENAQPINVIKIDSATGQVLSTPDETAQTPMWLAIKLDAKIDMPGKVFVRGRGLDSEWRGRLTVSGTTAAPRLTGKLEVVRGTYSFLGKTANLDRGTITFLGERRVNPQIDIKAEIPSPDVTAIVQLTGTAKEPKLQLSSRPQLPQDEILSRVLFGTSISQISPAQGLEIAQAAASLATGGGGLGVLDRVRRSLGLDRLSIGSTGTTPTLPGVGIPGLAATPGLQGSSQPPAGLGTSPVPIGATTSTTPGAAATAVSAGKYVANGVYVGVTQGVNAASSTVNVQIDVTQHITIDTSAGQTSGPGVGVGLNWKLDY